MGGGVERWNVVDSHENSDTADHVPDPNASDPNLKVYIKYDFMLIPRRRKSNKWM